MLDQFTQRRKQIEAFLKTYLDQKGARFSTIGRLGEDLTGRLAAFAAGGKMIRGVLVSLGYALFKGDAGSTDDEKQLIAAGAAMELFQSALLIHDDIMDRDKTRRGKDSLFYQYSKLPVFRNRKDSYYLGEALGICGGDVSFFAAFEILAGLDLPPDVYRSILSLASKEMGYVGVAQMQDVVNGCLEEPVAENDILKLYLYKTGRYTFSLPLMTGGLLAGCSQETIAVLERLGESLGIIFQLKDDEIGIYGKQEAIGKPAGSDIREGKKTLYQYYLRNRASAEENLQMDRIFGNTEVGEEEIRFVQYLAERLGVRGMIAGKIAAYAQKSRSLIEKLPGSVSAYRKSLTDVLEYSLLRAS